MKIFYLSFLSLFFVPTVSGQITLIPDSLFEFHLVNEGIDTDGIINGQVFTTDIEDETVLYLPSTGATDLTGLQDFTNLRELTIFQMDIPEIDLSQNMLLERLSLDDLSLESLNISNNINLIDLTLFLNSPNGMFSSSMNSLNVTNNILLEDVNIAHVPLTHVDFSNNVNLIRFGLSFMPTLQTVNIKNNNNEQISFLFIENNINIECVQVDDPAAVIAGTEPPYDNWFFLNDPIITDDCQLGVAEYLSNQVSLVPNPTAGKLYLEVERLEVEGLFLYDTLGRLVLSKTNEFNSMDLSQLPQGFYLLEIETDQGKLTKKIVKE